MKAIYMGAPMVFCESCSLATGFGATLAAWLRVGDEDGEFALTVYQGSYWRALFHWLFE